MSEEKRNSVDCYGGRVASGVISDALDEAAADSGGNPNLEIALFGNL